MYRSLILPVLATLFLTSTVLAAECPSPFSANLNQFLLKEDLSCSGQTFPVVVNIIPANQTSVNGVWNPKCVKFSPYFELSTGNVVVDYSSTMASTLSPFVTLIDCNGRPSFLIDRTPTLETLPSGQKVNVNARVFTEDNQRSLLGYVAASEDQADKLVLRVPDTNVIATATKSWAGCGAIWVVTNSAGTLQIANAISFLITLKDNDGFSCIPTPATDSGLSKGGMFGVGFTLGAAIGAVITGPVVYYFMQRCKLRRHFVPLQDAH